LKKYKCLGYGTIGSLSNLALLKEEVRLYMFVYVLLDFNVLAQIWTNPMTPYKPNLTCTIGTNPNMPISVVSNI